MKVTVIIPTYNYAAFILQAIESICSQDYSQNNIELIVVDDGSTDNTKLVLQSLINDQTIQYLYQPNAGKAAATAKGIALATGDIIFNLDADDHFLPRKISKTVSIFEQYSEVVHVSSPATIVYENESNEPVNEPVPGPITGKPLNGPSLLRYFFEHKMLYGGGSTFAARTSVLKQMCWDAGVDMYTDEWLLIETLLHGDSYFLPEPLSVWRVHGNNYSTKTTNDKLRNKHIRLEQSSVTILRLLESNKYPNWLVKLYQLKHEVRRVVWAEQRQEKKLRDIIHFFRKGILSGNSSDVLKQYHAFNRLMPMWVTRWVRAWTGST